MSGTPRRLHYSHAEYLAIEDESPIRHEYLDGEIYAMAGGSPDHAALSATVIRLISNELPRGCRAFTSDLRVQVPATGLSTYPHAAVVCGRTQRAANDPLEVLIVSHRGPQLTLPRREPDGWTELAAAGGPTIEISSVGGRLAVDDVYREGLEDAGR